MVVVLLVSIGVLAATVEFFLSGNRYSGSHPVWPRDSFGPTLTLARKYFGPEYFGPEILRPGKYFGRNNFGPETTSGRSISGPKLFWAEVFGAKVSVGPKLSLGQTGCEPVQ